MVPPSSQTFGASQRGHTFDQHNCHHMVPQNTARNIADWEDARRCRDSFVEKHRTRLHAPIRKDVAWSPELSSMDLKSTTFKPVPRDFALRCQDSVVRGWLGCGRGARRQSTNVSV